MRTVSGLLLILLAMLVFAAASSLVVGQLWPHLPELADSNRAYHWGWVSGSVLVICALFYLGWGLLRAGLQRLPVRLSNRT